MAYKQFKGFKRVFSTNTAYSGATHGDFLYFVRENADDKEGQIWFQGMCYGSCRDSEIDKINTALAGFLTGATPTDVKQYIDGLIAGKDASVTGTSSDGHVTVQVDEADGALTAATVTTNDIASDAELKAVEQSLGFNGTAYSNAGQYISGDTVAADIDRLDTAIVGVQSDFNSEVDAIEEAVGLNPNGSYVPKENTNYLDDATSVEGEIAALDEALKEVADRTVTEGQSTENYVALGVTTTDGATVITIDDSALKTAIEGMDYTGVTPNGQAIVNVTEADGKITATQGDIAAEHVTIADAGNLFTATNVEGALAEIDAAYKAADAAIVGDATTSGNTLGKLEDRIEELSADAREYHLVKIESGLPATVKERYELQDASGNICGTTIDIAKDSHIVSITYNETTQKLIYKYFDASGVEQTTEVDMAHLILETEVENGIQSINGKLSIKLDTTGDDTGDGKFLTVGENGLKLDGVTDAINAAITGLSYADTAVAGQYVTEVDQTDGTIAVQRANVSDAVLNGYAKGQKPASTAISASDDVKGAIAKLEHQIDDAKAAATTKVVEGTDAGNNMEIVPTTGADSSVTYTVNLTDVASKAALDAEIAARKAVDGQNGDTYAANTGATYISGASSLNDADVKLDTALKAVADRSVVESGSVENYVSLDVTTDATGKTTIKIDDTALKTAIEAMDLSEVSASGAAIVAISETDGVVSAATGNVDTDHVVLASALTGSAVTANAGTQESVVLQQIVNAIDSLGGNALTAVTSTGNTLSVGTPSGNKQNIEFLKETATDTTVADGHLGLAQNANHEWYGVMYWIDEETA